LYDICNVIPPIQGIYSTKIELPIQEWEILNVVHTIGLYKTRNRNVIDFGSEILNLIWTIRDNCGDMVAEWICHHPWHNLFVAGPAHSLEVAGSNPARTTREFLVGSAEFPVPIHVMVTGLLMGAVMALDSASPTVP